MATQRQIEDAVGIDESVAAWIMRKDRTKAAENALSLLRMQVSCFDPCGFELLKCAVRDCAKEMAAQ